MNLKRDVGPLEIPPQLMLLDKLEQAKQLSQGISYNTEVVPGVSIGDLIKLLVNMETFITYTGPGFPKVTQFQKLVTMDQLDECLKEGWTVATVKCKATVTIGDKILIKCPDKEMKKAWGFRQ